jgi:hypothetical protein
LVGVEEEGLLPCQPAVLIEQLQQIQEQQEAVEEEAEV